MIKYLKSSFLLFCSLPAILFSFATSCTHEPEDIFLNDTICFTTQVLPLIQNSCGISGCHDAITAEDGFIGTDYQSIIKAVKPGEPRKSKLYTVTTDIWTDDLMPPGNPLTSRQRNIIQLWILQGAENSICSPLDTNIKEEPNPLIDSICFTQDILPIFLSSCGTSGCHDATTHADGYTLTDYTSIMSDEEGVIPFNSAESKFLKVIRDDDPDDRMPPSPRAPLTADQIRILSNWMDDGALNSDCPEGNCDTLNAISFSDQVVPILENNCVSCHNSPSGNGGIQLNTYTDVNSVAQVERGGISVLMGTIRHKEGFSAMPPSNRLDECSVRIIELWNTQGRPDN